MKRWIAILGPQQVVLISNTHTHHKNTENYFKIKRGQEARCRKEGSLVQVIKRGLAILGPQQVVLISNTHTENYFKIKGGQEGVDIKKTPGLSNKKMVSYTGPSTVYTHKQHSRIKYRKLFEDQEETGWGRKAHFYKS